jgi:hypothetical protein
MFQFGPRHGSGSYPAYSVSKMKIRRGNMFKTELVMYIRNHIKKGLIECAQMVADTMVETVCDKRFDSKTDIRAIVENEELFKEQFKRLWKKETGNELPEDCRLLSGGLHEFQPMVGRCVQIVKTAELAFEDERSRWMIERLFDLKFDQELNLFYAIDYKEDRIEWTTVKELASQFARTCSFFK